MMRPTTIRTLRKSLKWSQAKLATHLGITRRTVVRWESGRSRPHPNSVAAMQRLKGNDAQETLHSTTSTLA